MSDLIQEFEGKTFEEWAVWYQERYPDAIEDASGKFLRNLLLVKVFEIKV